jgi:hypothetical protein
MHWPRTQPWLPLGLLALVAASLPAQTIDDGLLIPRRQLWTGLVYTHDGWDEYWEGTLKRANGNIGTVTTQSLYWFANYGVTDRLNVIATLPYVWTHASQGVLHGMSGFQDLSVTAKLSLLETPFTKAGSLRALVAVAGTTPVSDYTPDFLPLSIGSASSRLSARATLYFQARTGWFVNGSAAYTWRGKVKLDRPSYFTDGHLYMSDEVAMPDVFDYTVSVGYMKNGLMVPISFSQQVTLGGGDIRRQDMPFVSNRTDFSAVDALVMHPVPKVRNLAARLAARYTVGGRNVGQSTTLSAGLLYTFRFP